MQCAASSAYPYPYLTVALTGISIVNPPITPSSALWVDDTEIVWRDGVNAMWLGLSDVYSLNTYGGTTTALLNTAL